MAAPPIITQAPPPASAREARIATHSHIKGLGLRDDGLVMEPQAGTGAQGFIGQDRAREALGLHLELLRMGRHAGRPLLMVGPPGTGKVSHQRSIDHSSHGIGSSCASMPLLVLSGGSRMRQLRPDLGMGRV